MKRNLGNLGTLVFFVFIFFYFVENKDALSQLLDVSLLLVLLLLCLKTIRILINGLFTKITLNAFGKKITTKETNYLSLISSLGNFFGPILGGASIRAVYLKRKFQLNYATFISTLYGFYLVSFMTNSLLGIVALMLLFSQTGSLPGMLFMSVVFISIFIFTTVLVVLPSYLLVNFFEASKFLPLQVRRSLLNMTNGWDVIKKHDGLILRLSLLNIIVITIAAVESYILYSIFVKDFTLLSVFLYTIFGSLSLLISFTPGAIGVREAIYVFTSAVIMLPGEQIIQTATVDRSSTFILLGVLFMASRTSRLKSIIRDNKDLN